ncbi:MAG: phenylalanine--tRNA ligase subunit beta [Patescibacteria group bacterium]|nr:phenylalanine--tRNA ligase subunit beta [Patescibacteria group bacterium]
MKISINTSENISQLSSPGVDSNSNSAELIDKIGAQLGAVEEVIPFGDKFNGVILVKIVSCEKHPQADKLNICWIDDGGKAENIERNEDGHIQVVCGAPNARAGLTVAWLPPGSTVPETVGKEPFVLGARELRGVVSNGMLASAKELALGDSHDGILEISEEVAPGTSFIEAYNLQGDLILDIENKMFTHRPDCFGFMGVAREIAGIQGIAFTSPEWYTPQPELPALEADELNLSVSNEIPDLVPRFSAIVLSDITVKPSPTWLQVELAKIGSRSINNIVDYTNYFMQLSGQPLHAYDYDKVAACSNDRPVIMVRKPHPDEKVTLLNGKVVEPRSEAILIATDKQAIGIGGVMGGADTEVDANTTRIIIESANFDMYSIRRTSMASGLFTDAVTRFNKGQSPLQTLAVLARIVDEIRNHADGKVASKLIDDNHLSADILERQSVHAPVVVTAQFINERLGFELGAEQMQSILQNVEFNVAIQDTALTITPPFWRTDIELREDIVEEIGRLYGFDKLPLALPQHSISPTVRNPLLDLKTALRKALSKAGANEMLTYSFVHGNLLEKVGQQQNHAFKISNALSPDLQYYRLSVMPSLLDKVHGNLKAGHNKFALYELGKSHAVEQIDSEGLPVEQEQLAVVLAADKKVASSIPGAPFYYARHYAGAILKDLGQGNNVSFRQVIEQQNLPPYFAPDRSAGIFSGEVQLGFIGEFTAAVRSKLKLPDFCAGFEIDSQRLLELSADATYQPGSRFPTITQDFTLKVSSELPYAVLFSFIENYLTDKNMVETNFTLSPKDIFQKSDDTEHKQITLRLGIGSNERTLTDKEVSELINEAVRAATQSFGADQI